MATVIQTTAGRVIKEPARDDVTIYAPNGKPHTCAPVDAREILEGDLGYTTELPKFPEKKHEHLSKHLPVSGGTLGETVEMEDVDQTTDEEVQKVAVKRGPGRPSK